MRNDLFKFLIKLLFLKQHFLFSFHRNSFANEYHLLHALVRSANRNLRKILQHKNRNAITSVFPSRFGHFSLRTKNRYKLRANAFVIKMNSSGAFHDARSMRNSLHHFFFTNKINRKLCVGAGVVGV